jgi:hypothetical protein
MGSEDNSSDPSADIAAVSSLGENFGGGNSPGAGPPRPRRPPVDCGDLDMRIAYDGTWFYRGSPILRLPLVKLFASVLRREADGGYWLVTPAERGRIEVEDAPFLAVELSVAGRGPAQEINLRTNLDEIVTAGPDHPLRVETAEDGAPAPYLLVRDGLEARLTRSVFYELVELGTEQEIAGTRQYGVWSNGVFFCLGEVEADW